MNGRKCVDLMEKPTKINAFSKMQDVKIGNYETNEEMYYAKDMSVISCTIYYIENL